MLRLTLLYFSTFVIMATLDVSWLTVVAHDFYIGQIGEMLVFNPLPAVLFYVMYIAGVLVFVSAKATRASHVALYGALFGFCAYATYDLTNMATLRGWTWAVVAVDIGWGTFNTGLSATLGWLVTHRLRRG